jgi:pyruvate formate lyase activating enzyme
MDEGLRYVYTGNVHDEAGGSTYCSGCRKPLIVRDWYRIEDYSVTPEGTCPDCGTVLPGRFEAFRKQFGRRRIPLFLNRAA